MATISTTFRLVDEMSNPLNAIRDGVSRTVKGFESLSGKIVAINSAVQLFSTVVNKIQSVLSKPIQDASEYESLLTRLVVATGDATTAQKEFQQLKEFAKTTPFDLPGVVQASVMFRNAGVEADKLIPTIRMLGDVAQGNNDYFNRMAINFMQIKSAGKATMQDLNQFAYMGVPIKQVLADMGVTGVATASDIEKAFKIMTSAGGQFYNSMNSNASTYAGQLSNMQDAIQQFSAEIGSIFLPMATEIISMIGNVFSFLTAYVQKIKQSISSFVEYVKTKMEQFKSYVAENISTVVLSLTILSVGIVTVGAIWIATHAKMLVATIATNAKMIASTVATAVVISAKWIATMAKLVATHAVQMAKMAVQWIIGLGPVGWIIGGVIAMISSAIIICMKLGVTFEDVGRVIGNAFGAIKAFGYNAFVAIWNIVATVWNKINDFLKWLRVENLGEMKIKEYVSVEEEMAKNAQKGSETGKKIDEWLKNFMKKVDKDSADFESQSENLKLQTDGSGNLLVSDKSLINISDEYKELLSKRAREKFFIQQSQITPNVVVNANTQSSAEDIAKVVGEAITELTETLNENLSGGVPAV